MTADPPPSTTAPYYSDADVTLHLGDSLDVLPTLADASVDAVVCDPPYELGFMGKAWDASGIAYNVDVWQHCWRVLKPGGHLVAFGGTRTYHRMTVAIEDAGFEIRDSLHWIYGSGFPKSHDVSKAIDKQRDDRGDIKRIAAYLKDAADRAGVTARDIDSAFGFAGQMAGQWLTDRDWVLLPSWDQWSQLRELLGLGAEMDAEVWRLNGRKGTPGEAWSSADVLATEDRCNEPSGIVSVGQGERTPVTRVIKAPNSDDAARWSGWGTAIKPAHEPIVLARKPLDGTVAANVLRHGTGVLNVDACRVAGDADNARANKGGYIGYRGGERPDKPYTGDTGRWPTNVLLGHGPDCAEQCAPGCPVAEMDAQSGHLTSGKPGVHRLGENRGAAYGAESRSPGTPMTGHGDSGGASRFFPVFRYEAKAPASERPRLADGTAHTTVKPLDLMQWLVRLVTPPGGMVLDPFAGSGTTLEACVVEGFRAVGIEREEPHAQLCVARLSKPITPSLFGLGEAS